LYEIVWNQLFIVTEKLKQAAGLPFHYRRRIPYREFQKRYPESLALTLADTSPISARPESLALSNAITLPMADTPEAPVSSTAAVIRASISSGVSGRGM